MVDCTRRFVLCLALCYFVFVFSILLALQLPSLGRKLVMVLFVRLCDLQLFDFVCFHFTLVFGKGCGLWLWHSLGFSLIPFFKALASIVYLRYFADKIASILFFQRAIIQERGIILSKNKYVPATLSWGIHIRNFKTVACTVLKLCYASKRVRNGRTDECPRSIMPLPINSPSFKGLGTAVFQYLSYKVKCLK